MMGSIPNFVLYSVRYTKDEFGAFSTNAQLNLFSSPNDWTTNVFYTFYFD